MGERRLGRPVLAEVQAAAAEHDVARNVVGVEFQALAEDIPGFEVVAVLAENLRVGREDGPLGILLPTALELLDLAVWWHP